MGRLPAPLLACPGIMTYIQHIYIPDNYHPGETQWLKHDATLDVELCIPPIDFSHTCLIAYCCCCCCLLSSLALSDYDIVEDERRDPSDVGFHQTTNISELIN